MTKTYISCICRLRDDGKSAAWSSLGDVYGKLYGNIISQSWDDCIVSVTDDGDGDDYGVHYWRLVHFFDARRGRNRKVSMLEIKKKFALDFDVIREINDHQRKMLSKGEFGIGDVTPMRLVVVRP